VSRPIEEACYWLARRERMALPPLRGRRDADVAVVGAGFTGLWAALFLKALAPDLDVVVVEQETAAYGASGRNAGMVIDTIDHSHELAVSHFGEIEARRLATLGRENMEEMLASVAARGIDCDLERNGTLHVALSAAHVESFGRDVERAESLGVNDLVVLDTDEARERLHSDRYEGALFNPRGAVLDPVELVEGLAREARRLGVGIFEQTRVTSIEAGGERVRLRTVDGEVVTKRVILATSAYSHLLLPSLSTYFVPVYDYVVVSEPLTRAQRDVIGWRGREGVNDGRAFFNYYRLTKDDRILWGTSEATYYGDNRVDPSCDHSERHYAELRGSFVAHFPRLADLAFPYAWGGPIDATTRFTPFFGTAHGGRVFYGLGFTGHGIATTHLAGKILAHMCLARPSELLDLELVRKKPLPYPPEPFRSWGVNAVTRDLRRVDAGGAPSVLLRVLDALGIGLSS
jgi:glycine/D-amino acid oxidase-like deaminating enzyme